MTIKQRLVAVSLMTATLSATSTFAQQSAQWNTPAAGNPLLPGYFADPTIRKFGDTYYIYATTDGTGNGYGPAQVWMSKDFVNWRNVIMNWPTTEVVWAPDVVQQPDGSYRYYYCTPCEVRVGESLSPTGPWTNRLGASDAVLVPDRFVHNAITLDPALFRDDDGSEYLYFGTWGIYKGFGCGVARLSADGKSFDEKKLIPNTEITDFFEAPYVFKRNGIYYFTYSSGSCHDDTYRVQYATSTTGPMGPYQYKGCILKTNADGTIHGPGHHSILVDGDNYYIVYHRHNNPHAIHGFHRQICIDPLTFDAQGNILPVQPTHEGVIPASLQENARRNSLPNLAFGAKVEASSTYDDPHFKPEYAVDDNNGTLWRAASAQQQAWLQIDLGKVTAFNEVLTQFEYPTFFYQYRIETSDDTKQWNLYSDRTGNTLQGSPMIDTGEAKARYIRITITGTQKSGHFPAIWNVKIYRATKKNDPVKLLPNPPVDEAAVIAGYPWIHQKDIERNLPAAPYEGTSWQLNAEDYPLGTIALQGVPVVPKNGKSAFRFSGHKTITIPASQTPVSNLVYNAPYTLTAWVLNPDVSNIETIAQFMPVGNDLATIELRNGNNPGEGIIAHNASFENAGAASAIRQGEWQHWTVTYDGFNERIYCNGQLVSQKNIFIMLRPGGPITIGATAHAGTPFTGYLHSLAIYDRPFTADDVLRDYQAPSDMSPEALNALSAMKSSAQTTDASPYRCQTTLLSPTLVNVSITDATGQPLTEGLFEFQIICADDTTGISQAPLQPKGQTVITARGKHVYALVHDAFGNTSPLLSSSLPTTGKRPHPKSFRTSGNPGSATTFTDHAVSIMKKATDGAVRLESAGRNLSADPSQNGPMETVTLTGDFVAQCHIADMTGLSTHNTPAYNEGGLIIIYDETAGRQSLLQLGVFPNYNCGNMLTLVNAFGRPQYPNNNGWNYDPYLQLQRCGNQVFVRTSSDGVVWTDMPHSPIRLTLPDTLRVGIYQTTYSDNHAYFSFDDIHIWQTR